ncbi:hypothetical protein D7030_08450 [Flavobacteriaceae bacterium AU392]|nr:hypothetical protein D1817_14455 [Flavobacteriaceae bacterium]RKM84053.1 hypothetical protein D7030_08450 [Flavobacteriaceae bacterium AU392]
MSRNIIRQIVDIQNQADRLIKNKANIVEIEQFSQYNDEIKSFLESNIEDEFILNYVRAIPNLDIEQEDTKLGILNIVLSIFFGGITSYRERQKADNALNKIRDIRGKYASAEFMLKNYFS